jgi:hypothetical protein
MLGYCKVARYLEENRIISGLKAMWEGSWKVRYVTIVTYTPKMEARVFVEASKAFCQTKFNSPIGPLYFISSQWHLQNILRGGNYLRENWKILRISPIL